MHNFITKFHQKRPAYRRKVFGIGYPKTGTTTLGACFRKLGYKHKTFDMQLATEICRGNYIAAIEAAKHYESFEDWPWFLCYETLDKAYPNAKFILTIRKNSDAYVSSLYKHRKKQGVFESSFQEPPWWQDVFGYAPDYWNKDFFQEQYTSHNSSVINYFHNQPHKLLIVCWEKGDNWRALCDFLSVTAPQAPFPHLNKA